MSKSVFKLTGKVSRINQKLEAGKRGNEHSIPGKRHITLPVLKFQKKAAKNST
jgi:hypothetical protein